MLDKRACSISYCNEAFLGFNNNKKSYLFYQ